jgi:GT2 family glycosyltransferase/glycosyltransferase involved in cell wall biosynthesis
VLIANGTVYANVPAHQANSRIEVSVGNVTVPLQPSKNDPLTMYSLGHDTYWETAQIDKHITSSSSEELQGKGFSAWVNHLHDWTLGGTRTVQIMIHDRELPCRLDFGQALVVKAAAAEMVFETWIAQHRATGTLHVTFTDENGKTEAHHAIELDPACRGGTSRSGYQHVSIPLPKGRQYCSTSLALEYTGHAPEDEDNNPFFFLADTRISGPARKGRSLLRPIVCGDLAPLSSDDRVWMEALIPTPLHNDATLDLRIDASQRSLLKAIIPELVMQENYGHTLIIDSNSDVEALLFIDGAPVEQLRFGANSNILRLPPQYLTGATRNLTITDPSGSITYFRTQELTPAVSTPADVILRETPAPFPSTLFAQTPRRYASLRAKMAHATATTDFDQLAYALSVVEAGYGNVKLKPLVFDRPESPDVSIIIPAHNKVEVTYLALCSLLLAHNEASFEVIVVDDASTDETATLEDIVSGITVLHNETAQRFIRACNLGAAEAKGDYIVLLNNDVEVTTGWLDELIAAFDRFENVGLAGSKLLYPDGALQDAGGIIWGSGNPWNYGNRQNPEDPRFSYARQADYLSGAAMMVPTKLWRALDGLSSYMEPMYFEDTDFAFKVREAGYSTWFIPSSVVYHYEGMTSGTDVSTGFKKYQEVNRPKFKRKWGKAYANFGKEGHYPDLEKDRGINGRVLFIDYTTPRPDQDAGSYAALAEIKLVQSLGYKVSFMPANMAHLGSYTEELQKMGVEMIYAPFYLSTQDYLAKHATDFDAFYITRYYVAQGVLNQLRSLAPRTRIIFNNADLHFLREIRAASAEKSAVMLEKALKTRSDEMAIINKVDVILSYNDVEHSVIQAYSDGKAKVVKCPWVVDVPEARAPLEGRKGMSFLGSFRHHPNAEGIKWFVRDILPAINGTMRAAPDLAIYGAGMTEEIKAIANDQIHPIGFVADLADVYDGHRVFVAPLLSGAGIKGKVLSALASGIPCVLTPTAAEGIGLRSGHDCFIVESPEQWADAIKRLMNDDILWAKIADNAQAYMQESYSFAVGRERMREAFEAADLYNSRE